MTGVLAAGVVVLLFAVAGRAAEPDGKTSRPPWPPANGVISRRGMLRPKKRALIAPVKIDGTHWGGAIYPRDVSNAKKRERTKLAVKENHAAGAKFIGSINGRGFYHKSMDSEAVRLLDGRPYTYPAMNNAVFKCTLNPKMFDAFVSTAKRCVDLGMDGFILDSWMGEGGRLCFCPHCLAFYRECLKRHRGDPQFKGLADVDPDTFDYGQYLRDKGIAKETPYYNYPFGHAFSKYRLDEVIAQKRRFWETIRAYADEHAKRPFYLTANVFSAGAFTFDVAALLDYFLVELPYFSHFNGYPPMGTSIALHKRTRMAGKRAVCQPGSIDTARALIGKPSTATLFKIWIAEAYASGNLFDMVPREFAGFRDGKVVYLDLPIADMAPYYAFVQAHPAIYTETASPAKVGVLYSMAAWKLFDKDSGKEFDAVCKLLYDAHYQFDSVLIGDGKWNKTLPSVEELSKYDVLIAVRPQAFRKETIDRLLAYKAAGGKILLCGRFRTGSPSYAALCKAVLGRQVPPREVRSFIPYIKDRDPAWREQLVQAIGPGPVLSTNAPAEVGILCWRVGGRTLIHLINSDYVQDDDTVRDVQNIRITLSLPGRRARLLSPDGNGAAAPLPVKNDGRVCSFTVPRLHIYSVVVVEE